MAFRLNHLFDSSRRNDNRNLLLIGWQEWCALPKLMLPAIKAKVDTGAKTSALHAKNIIRYSKEGVAWVNFEVNPLPGQIPKRSCHAKIADERIVMNSGGHQEQRIFIVSDIVINQSTWEIEISLTNREPLRFRMLLGRSALKGAALIDAGKSLCQGRMSKVIANSLYGDE